MAGVSDPTKRHLWYAGSPGAFRIDSFFRAMEGKDTAVWLTKRLGSYKHSRFIQEKATHRELRKKKLQHYS